MGGGLRAATRRTGAIAVAVTSLALLAAPAAAAHPYLVASTPESGVVATGSVSSVQLAFTARLVLEGSSVTVPHPQGHPVRVRRLQPGVRADRELRLDRGAVARGDRLVRAAGGCRAAAPAAHARRASG